MARIRFRPEAVEILGRSRAFLARDAFAQGGEEIPVNIREAKRFCHSAEGKVSLRRPVLEGRRLKPSQVVDS